MAETRQSIVDKILVVMEPGQSYRANEVAEKLGWSTPATRAAIGYGIELKLIDCEGSPHRQLFRVLGKQEREERARQAEEERLRREASHATLQKYDTTWQTFMALCMAVRRS
jgi:hypothetical protein